MESDEIPQDTDDPSLFVGVGANPVENTDSVGLNGEDSTRSVLVNFSWSVLYPGLVVQWQENASRISFDVKIVAVNGGGAFAFQNMTTGATIGEVIPLDTWTRVTIESGWIPDGQAFGLVKDGNAYASMDYNLYFDNIVFE